MKINCALIGSGNIGTDLMYKLQRSEILNPLWMVGIDPESDGLLRAKEAGMKITSDGVWIITIYFRRWSKDCI